MIFYKLLLNLIKTALSASLPQTSFALNSTRRDVFAETTCIYSSLGDVVFGSTNVRLGGAIRPLHIIMSV